MRPNKKLVWFQQNPDWCDEDRIEARKVIIDRWMKSYVLPDVTPGSAPTPLNTTTDLESTANTEVGLTLGSVIT